MECSWTTKILMMGAVLPSNVESMNLKVICLGFSYDLRIFFYMLGRPTHRIHPAVSKYLIFTSNLCLHLNPNFKKQGYKHTSMLFKFMPPQLFFEKRFNACIINNSGPSMYMWVHSTLATSLLEPSFFISKHFYVACVWFTCM